MRVVVGGLVVAEPAQGFDHRVLRFRLPRIDHVVNFRNVAEMRMIFLALHGGYPALVLVGIAVELAIAEIATQQAKLPHVVGDVLADIADSTVGADDHFLIFFGNLAGFPLRPRYPLCPEIDAVPARRITQQPLFFPSLS